MNKKRIGRDRRRPCFQHQHWGRHSETANDCQHHHHRPAAALPASPPHAGEVGPPVFMIADDTDRQDDDDNDNDNGDHEMRRPLVELDRLSRRHKIAHVLRVAQPFGDRRGGTAGPAFPTDRVSTTGQASRRIVQAAHHATQLWGTEETSRRGRDPQALREWRDIWSHPAVYRRVFGEWVGYTYAGRRLTQAASKAAEAASYRGNAHSHPAPSWSHSSTSTGTRGLKAGSTWLYQHGPPERFGHRTRLVATADSRLAQQAQEDLREALRSETSESQESADPAPEPLLIPGAVVRTRDLGWYLGGFLGSVLVWTHLALNEAPALRRLGRENPTESGFDLAALLRRPRDVFDPELAVAWNQLGQMLRSARCELKLPLPDLVRVPQEWCQAMDPRYRGEAGQDVVLWQGLSGPERRQALRQLPRDLGMPEWMRPGDPAVLHSLRRSTTRMLAPPAAGKQPPSMIQLSPTEGWQQLTGYLQMQQIQHATTVYNARASGRLPMQRIDLIERYVPLPEPPHAMPALFLPWTGLLGSTERVHRLASVRTLGIKWLALPCLETGLSLEEWGRCWTQEQRQHRVHQGRLTDDQRRWRLTEAVLGGQSVPGWDDAPRRRLVAYPIAVLDPNGPLGDGHRLYEWEDRLQALTSHGQGNPDAHHRATDLWLRLDRMNTVERIRIEGPGPDEEGRWEDSGIELPTRLVRLPGRDRRLRSLESIHLPAPPDVGSLRKIMGDQPHPEPHPEPPQTPEMAARIEDRAVRIEWWRQAAGRASRRVWVPQVLSPWPVSLQAEAVDLSALHTQSLTDAPVVRCLWIRRVAVPQPTWLRELLSMPTPVSSLGSQDLGLTGQEWWEVLKDAGMGPALRPTARRTLVMLGLDQVSYRRSSPGMTPVKLAATLLPGLPPPLHRDATAASKPSPFRHYPNLTLVSLHNSGLGDLPPGLLDWAIRTRWRLPPTGAPEGGRRRPPFDRVVMWDLSQNPGIEELSERTLVSLVWLARILVVAEESESEPSGSTPRPTFRINLADTPLADKIGMEIVPTTTAATSTSTGDGDVVWRWDRYIYQRLKTMARTLRTAMRRQSPEQRKQSEGRLATQALFYWMQHPEAVSQYLGYMFYQVPHRVFAQEMRNRRSLLDRQRYRWMI